MRTMGCNTKEKVARSNELSLNFDPSCWTDGFICRKSFQLTNSVCCYSMLVVSPNLLSLNHYFGKQSMEKISPPWSFKELRFLANLKIKRGSVSHFPVLLFLLHSPKAFRGVTVQYLGPNSHPTLTGLQAFMNANDLQVFPSLIRPLRWGRMRMKAVDPRMADPNASQLFN